jgi:hypothetical protein
MGGLPRAGRIRQGGPGRLHFLSRDRHYETGWIFLEGGEDEIRERFGEFSAVELWHFLESLSGSSG